MCLTVWLAKIVLKCALGKNKKHWVGQRVGLIAVRSFVVARSSFRLAYNVGAASTTFHAGDKRSSPHNFFRGCTAAVAPNRSLAAGIFESIVLVHFTVGLYSVFGSGYFFDNALDACR
jgi:hypothetical protein